MAVKTSLVLDSSIGDELNEEEAAVLSELLEYRELDDGACLIEEGTTDDSLHVLLSGKLLVVKKAGADETTDLAVLRDGDLAGELSFIDGHKHSVSLAASGKCRILSLGRDRFESVIDEHPRLAYKVMRAIARSIHRIVHRMNSDFIELNNYVFKQHGRY